MSTKNGNETQRNRTVNSIALSRKAAVGLIMCCLLYVAVYISITSNKPIQMYTLCDRESCNTNIVRFDQIHWQNKTNRKILLWTKFFGTNKWPRGISEHLKRSRYNCSVTTNRSEIKTADALIFHYLDLWFWEETPRYRNLNQVWVMFNLEPTTFVHYTGMFSWKNQFNWTMSYRQDSTVYSPYGMFLPLSFYEKNIASKNYASRNFAREKSKMVAAIYSDCANEGKRYEFIREFRHYVPVDFYGDCGNLSCPFTKENKKTCKNKTYRFRVAFENSNCRDYVTEKFFDALSLESIPLVNWKPGQSIPGAPPKSYINVHDFESLKELGDHLIFLSKNENEYNEYFKWKFNYTYYTDCWRTFKTLCDELHKPRQAQVVEDASKWMANDMCESWSVSAALKRQLQELKIAFGM